MDILKLRKLIGIDQKENIRKYQEAIYPNRINERNEDKNHKKAAVMVLLYPHKDSIYFILTQRHDYVGPHGGQISLPGGKLEPVDTTLMDCAIRETHEEIGVLISQKDIYRKMKSIYIAPSNFYVQPYLAILNRKPTFTAEQKEVKEILMINLKELATHNLKKDSIEVNNKQMSVNYYRLNNKIVWGATATILAELHALIDNKNNI